jgi:hypothetical protein
MRTPRLVKRCFKFCFFVDIFLFLFGCYWKFTALRNVSFQGNYPKTAYLKG